MTHGYVYVGGGRLYHEIAGDGPPVALIHPGLWDRRTWDDQFEPFAERHRVIRYDLRGYGLSSRPEPGSAYSHVVDLAAILDAVGIDRAALVGCSMGGRIALDFALTHPDRVLALVLVAADVSGTEEGLPEEETWFSERWAPIESAIAAGDLERAMDLTLDAFW
ncbi:MAG TPA: alpha/beta fold hydrolase, partial [Actinomycetota bacterium]